MQNSVLTVGVRSSISDASTQDLVLSVGGGSTGSDALFAIGGSFRPETEASYIVAPYCGFAEVTNTDDAVAIRSDPVIFGTGSTVDPPTSGPPVPPQDLDGDGYLNADDSCPMLMRKGDQSRPPLPAATSSSSKRSRTMTRV